MNVLQLIDSLHAGGAERVAVNYANALVSQVEASYLCATREEGLLKERLSNGVRYLFLNRKSTIDLRAIKKLSRFIKEANIDIIHAHATSYFIATIIKILNPSIVLIWHDHYGKSEFLEKRPTFYLKCCSKFFNHVFSVNMTLERWAKEVLGVKSVSYLPNYAVLGSTEQVTKLKGVQGKRILCLANLRYQKDHMTLLEAFKSINKKYADWTLHLVGQDFNDAYSNRIKKFIISNDLEQHVFIYGSCLDTNHILNQSTVGVLSSKSEGLPIALLEYGLAKLPVVATHVGDCGLVISNKDEGMLVAPENHQNLTDALISYINDLDLRQQVAENLQNKVKASFSESSSIDALMTIYKKHQR